MSTHRCYAPDASGPLVRLSETDAHHVRHVLRLSEGDVVGVFDGRGHEWQARIVRTTRQDIDVELLEAVTPQPESPVAVTLALGILKGDSMSTVVRDATALGVSRIVPLSSSHVAVPAAARRDVLTTRLHRVAASSSAQCGRAVVPDVAPAATFDDVLATEPADLRLMALEPGRASVVEADWQAANRPSTVLLLVGPEGGWSEGEVRSALASDVRPLLLGARTLRAELAPTVALSVIRARWGW